MLKESIHREHLEQRANLLNHVEDPLWPNSDPADLAGDPLALLCVQAHR